MIEVEGWTHEANSIWRHLFSLDIRKRILAAVEGGTSRRAAADRFPVSESTAIKLLQQWEHTGSLEPGRIGGHRPFALAAHEKLMRELIVQAPDSASFASYDKGAPSNPGIKHLGGPSGASIGRSLQQ